MSGSNRPNVSVHIPQKSLIGPNTKFYIDYSWWEQTNLSLESFINKKLGENIEGDATKRIDLIDTQTGEVRQMSGFEYAVQNLFSQTQRTNELIQRSTVVDAVLFALLENGNRPMTATDIAVRVKRSADIICKTLGGHQIHQGIRIYVD